MKRAVVTGSTLVMLLILALVSWWKIGGFCTITIINISNLQSRLKPMTADENPSGKSYGGAALISSAVKDLKKSYPDALIVENGNLVKGLWWWLWKGEPEFSVAKKIGVKAGMLGKNEFKFGQQHLKEALIQNSAFPILATNINFDDPQMDDLTDKRLILTTPEGIKIGIFSLTSPQLAAKIRAGEEITTNSGLIDIAAYQIKKLRRSGAQAIILLTNYSLEEGLGLASRIKGLSLIISGASIGGEPSGEPPIYWIGGPKGWVTAVVPSQEESGRSVSAFTLTLQRRHPIPELTEIKNVTLNSGLVPDPEIEEIVSGFAARMDEMLRHTIGFFATPVDARQGYAERKHPLPLGAFIADAYRWKTGADIAVINTGGIGGNRVFPSGPITVETVMEILPFQNRILVKEMSGRDIRKMLEFSASALVDQADSLDCSTGINHGCFLHFSGLTASFALNSPHQPPLINENGKVTNSGDRVEFIWLTGRGEAVPLDDNYVYTVAMPDFIAEGGNKYTFLPGLPTKNINTIDYEAVIDYLDTKNNPLLNLKDDNRLRLKDD